jgi:DNA-binding NarL/FixJ family response regulator
MAVDQYVCAEALVFKPEPVKRTAVLGCLRELGFQKINQASSFDELNALLQSSSPDILVCASDYADEDLIKLVQSLREGKVAPNPFMIVLALSWCSDDETVTAYRNAGVDGFLSLPVSTPTLGDFLKAQIQKRKKTRGDVRLCWTRPPSGSRTFGCRMLQSCKFAAVKNAWVGGRQYRWPIRDGAAGKSYASQ